MNLQFQPVTGDDATWRMQDIDMTGCTFGMERTLHQKRTEVPPRTKAGHPFALDEAQLETGAPARLLLELFLALRQRHPQAPENTRPCGREAGQKQR